MHLLGRQFEEAFGETQGCTMYIVHSGDRGAISVNRYSLGEMI